MFISQQFKDHISSKVNDTLLVKYGLNHINTLTNEIILQKLQIMCSNVKRELFISPESGTDNNFFIYSSYDWGKITAIDDEFIRTNKILYRRGHIDLMINTLFEPLVVYDIAIGDVVRVKSNIELRAMGQSSYMEYRGEMWRVTDRGNGYANCSDPFGVVMTIPLRVLEKTKYRNLEDIYFANLRNKIRAKIEDDKKKDTGGVTKQYQEALREFMDKSRDLDEFLSDNIDELADRKIEQIRTFKGKFQKIPKIESIDRNKEGLIRVRTRALYIDGDETKCIGKFTININSERFDINISNSVVPRGQNQHPHVNASMACCFGGWVNPLRESYKKSDYYTLVLGLIDFLESYNEGSPYIRLDRFLSEHKVAIEELKKAEKEDVIHAQKIQAELEAKEVLAEITEVEVMAEITGTEILHTTIDDE